MGIYSFLNNLCQKLFVVFKRWVILSLGIFFYQLLLTLENNAIWIYQKSRKLLLINWLLIWFENCFCLPVFSAFWGHYLSNFLQVLYNLKYCRWIIVSGQLAVRVILYLKLCFLPWCGYINQYSGLRSLCVFDFFLANIVYWISVDSILLAGYLVLSCIRYCKKSTAYSWYSGATVAQGFSPRFLFLSALLWNCMSGSL